MAGLLRGPFALAVAAATVLSWTAVQAAPDAGGRRHLTAHAADRMAHAGRQQSGSRHIMTLRYATVPGVVPRPGHLASLVGDQDTGLGFYALPRQFRASAARARYAGQDRNRPGDAIRYAIASEQGGSYYYGIGGEDGYRDRNHHAMFNPVDGYGTPFFAGYYGPAGDPDDDHGPSGQPYN